MSEPQTEAGIGFVTPYGKRKARLKDVVCDIEREAAAQERARLLAAFEAWEQPDKFEFHFAEKVRALLSEQP